MRKSKKDEWQAAKWLLRHSKGYVKLGLVYRRGNKVVCAKGYVVVDFVPDMDRRRSIKR